MCVFSMSFCISLKITNPPQHELTLSPSLLSPYLSELYTRALFEDTGTNVEWTKASIVCFLNHTHTHWLFGLLFGFAQQ